MSLVSVDSKCLMIGTTKGLFRYDGSAGTDKHFYLVCTIINDTVLMLILKVVFSFE